MDYDSLWTPEDVAREKGCNVMTVYRAIRTGALPAVRAFGRYGVRPEDAREWTPATWGGSRGGGRPRKRKEE